MPEPRGCADPIGLGRNNRGSIGVEALPQSSRTQALPQSSRTQALPRSDTEFGGKNLIGREGARFQTPEKARFPEFLFEPRPGRSFPVLPPKRFPHRPPSFPTKCPIINFINSSINGGKKHRGEGSYYPPPPYEDLHEHLAPVAIFLIWHQ